MDLASLDTPPNSSIASLLVTSLSPPGHSTVGMFTDKVKNFLLICGKLAYKLLSEGNRQWL